jgi:hypothetical protein
MHALAWAWIYANVLADVRLIQHSTFKELNLCRHQRSELLIAYTLHAATTVRLALSLLFTPTV